MKRRISAAMVAMAALAAVAPASAQNNNNQDADGDAGGQQSAVSRGPSSSADPYVLPVAPGVSTQSLLTVGDNVNGYKMVGVPDGLGAFDAGGRTFGLLINQEIGKTAGLPRAHGQKGSFISRWTIDRQSHAVTAGSDLIQPGVEYYDYNARAYTTSQNPLPGLTNRDGSPANVFTAAFARFCSATLTKPGQLLNRRTARGTDEQVYFANEENGDDGRVFGVTLDGVAKQLPRLGLFSWENAPVADTRSDTTLVVGQEDGGSGQLRLYAGHKRAAGDAFERAGLTNGTQYVLDAGAVRTDAGWRAQVGKGVAHKVELTDIDWKQSGRDQNAEAAAYGLSLNRIEDGAWDPRPDHRNEYWFTTTEGAARPDGTDGGGLWKLTVGDLDRPQSGDITLELVLDGSESWGAGEPGIYKPDNVGFDSSGNLLIQEDPGNAAHIARVVAMNVDSRRRVVVARFDKALFSGPSAITQDEESSGIIDARRFLGGGWFLFDAQVHKAIAPDPDGLVEMGQLLALRVDDWDALYRRSGLS
jgi:hypothetical protein